MLYPGTGGEVCKYPLPGIVSSLPRTQVIPQREFVWKGGLLVPTKLNSGLDSLNATLYTLLLLGKSNIIV